MQCSLNKESECKKEDIAIGVVKVRDMIKDFGTHKGFEHTKGSIKVYLFSCS